MKPIKIIIRGNEYMIESGLHRGFYTVTCGHGSGMLGKTASGSWELSLQTSEVLDVSADELGSEIEKQESELGR